MSRSRKGRGRNNNVDCKNYSIYATGEEEVDQHIDWWYSMRGNFQCETKRRGNPRLNFELLGDKNNAIRRNSVSKFSQRYSCDNK